MKTKRQYSERILIRLQNDHRNIDFKINERQVFLMMDEVVNAMATDNYLANWKLTGAGIDEGFITTFEPVTITDPVDGNYSYLDIPSNYAALPKNRGIDGIYPLKYTTTNQQSVIILSHMEYRQFMNNPARSMEGRLWGYLKGMRLTFGKCEVGKKYGPQWGVRLVVRDSSTIANDQWYPIPSDVEEEMIEKVVEKLLGKRATPTDSVRDNKDQAA
jgi:hypothetical protein